MESAIFQVVREKNVEKLRELFEEGIDVNICSRNYMFRIFVRRRKVSPKRVLVRPSAFGFIGGICLPCYDLLVQVLPGTEPMQSQCKTNLETWKRKSEQRKRCQELKLQEESKEERNVRERPGTVCDALSGIMMQWDATRAGLMQDAGQIPCPSL